jgi:hypothetical protein
VLLDPRVKVTPDVEQIFALTRQVEDAARKATKARAEVQAFLARLRARGASVGSRALLDELQALAPASDSKGSGTEEGQAPAFAQIASVPMSPATLTNISGRLITSVMGMQGSELPPTQTQLAACRKQLADYSAVMARWTALRLRR